MYYKLKENFVLRGWKDNPYAIREINSGYVEFHTETVFQALSLCNGQIDFDSFIVPGAYKQVIAEVKKSGTALEESENPFETGFTEEQEYKLYPNRHITQVHWSITGKCNMRCRHCYMSAPQAKFGELSHEKCMSIVKEISDAGIYNVSLTGGEPLVREDFMEIVDALLAEKITIKQIYTNGMLVNDELLDALIERGIRPEFSLSFDGVGWHDWLRGIDGAEKIAIDAIKLLRSKGFRVTIESAFHKKSIDSIVPTMNLLAELGVASWKTNPVAGSGNWLNEGTDLDLSHEELYGAYLKFIPEYIKAGSPISVMLGGFFYCSKGSTKWSSVCKKAYSDEDERLKQPLCGCARNMMYISADGKLLPCMPLAGLPFQITAPSIKDMTIADALIDSDYLKKITTPISELIEHNKDTCGKCEHKLSCGGGCRSAALMGSETEDYLAADSYTCFFFKNGYEGRIQRAVSGSGVKS
ncbi:hypothetical protein FACS189499_09040 [Clostridia bacterium]|nr:hypothetical protein FACS189499_09040 [Clostridia bacterium]